MLIHYQIIIIEEQQRRNYETHATQKKRTTLALSYDGLDLRWSLSQIRPIVRECLLRAFWSY
jgi:hypothetical protein